jgi:hypothetical protein
MNCKKAISEEVEIVKQLDAQIKSLKEAPGARRSSSPPIRSNKSFHFQPLDEYPTSSPASLMILMCGLHQEKHLTEGQQGVNLARENPPKMEPGHVVHQGL